MIFWSCLSTSGGKVPARSSIGTFHTNLGEALYFFKKTPLPLIYKKIRKLATILLKNEISELFTQYFLGGLIQ
ncbi:MAG: hypothetical protein BGO78_06845 [Chloroflexi bacterium 44-23]|nr:MAG: hypothetical protein BGO78_06845 [Chloroflexi bacterium 44-23]